MPRALLDVPADQVAGWHDALRTAFAEAGLDVELIAEPDGGPVDYVIHSPKGPWQDFSVLPGLKAVLSLWAGVEGVIGNPTLTVPLTRMVDPGLREGMVEYVTGHVLRYHLGLDRHILNREGIWDPVAPPLARERRVGILGLGALGAACAEALARLKFRIWGWSRSQRDLPGVNCHCGEEGLEKVLRQAEILVLLLPQTAATENLLDRDRLALLPRGACIVNPARGTLIDDAALIAALDAGHIAHATLDVFRTEPLPKDHPFWAHPRVTVTPHIAAETRHDTAAAVIAENIRRGEAGEPFLHLADRQAGY